MLLEDTTTVDAETAFEDIEVALLPTGSTEQHGPALPLGTDAIAAETVARGLAAREDVVVLPTIPVGVSPHHRQFHGTLWVTDDTFDRYVAEIVESVAAHGVRKVVLVNGHGGNQPANDRLARRQYRDETAFVVPWNWWDGVGDTPYEELGDEVSVPGHAAGFEAAMMLHAAAHLVHEERFADAAAGRGDGSRFDHPAVTGYDFADFTDNGITGDPRPATADAGAALASAARASLADLVDWLAAEPMDDLEPLPHR